jgi:hypothetical protein
LRKSFHENCRDNGYIVDFAGRARCTRRDMRLQMLLEKHGDNGRERVGLTPPWEQRCMMHSFLRQQQEKIYWLHLRGTCHDIHAMKNVAFDSCSPLQCTLHPKPLSHPPPNALLLGCKLAPTCCNSFPLRSFALRVLPFFDALPMLPFRVFSIHLLSFFCRPPPPFPRI